MKVLVCVKQVAVLGDEVEFTSNYDSSLNCTGIVIGVHGGSGKNYLGTIRVRPFVKRGPRRLVRNDDVRLVTDKTCLRLIARKENVKPYAR